MLIIRRLIVTLYPICFGIDSVQRNCPYIKQRVLLQKTRSSVSSKWQGVGKSAYADKYLYSISACMLRDAHTVVGLKELNRWVSDISIFFPMLGVFFLEAFGMVVIGVDRAEGFHNGEGEIASSVVQVAGPHEAGGFLCPELLSV